MQPQILSSLRFGLDNYRGRYLARTLRVLYFGSPFSNCGGKNCPSRYFKVQKPQIPLLLGNNRLSLMNEENLTHKH